MSNLVLTFEPFVITPSCCNSNETPSSFSVLHKNISKCVMLLNFLGERRLGKWPMSKLFGGPREVGKKVFSRSPRVPHRATILDKGC